MPKQKRVVKSKKDIVSDIQLTQAAERRRSLIRDVIFPYLKEVNDTIGYSKVFLQALSGLVEGEYEKMRAQTSIGDIEGMLIKRMDEIFTISEPEQKREYDRYLGLIKKMKDVSVQDFSYAAELPRFIDGYITKDKNKEPITNVSIDEILGV